MLYISISYETKETDNALISFVFDFLLFIQMTNKYKCRILFQGLYIPFVIITFYHSSIIHLRHFLMPIS